ncbi:MAG: sulfotransferase [bacterium]
MTRFQGNLVIPGFPKCGTSSLHAYLAKHPSVCMSVPKEPHFFSVDARWVQGAEYHNSLFHEAGDKTLVFGEASTTYCVSERAIDRIADSLSSPKIIILLRDPVQRTISHYLWLFASGIETRPFRRAISESGYAFDPDVAISGNYMSYLEFSAYSKWVPKWRETFGSDQIMVVGSDELRLQPEQVLQKCFRFLKVRNIGFDVHEEQNRTTDVRAPIAAPAGKLISKALPESIRRRLKQARVSQDGFFSKALTRKINLPAIGENDQRWLSELLKEESRFFEMATSGGKSVER